QVSKKCPLCDDINLPPPFEVGRYPGNESRRMDYQAGGGMSAGVGKLSPSFQSLKQPKLWLKHYYGACGGDLSLNSQGTYGPSNHASLGRHAGKGGRGRPAAGEGREPSEDHSVRIAGPRTGASGQRLGFIGCGKGGERPRSRDGQVDPIVEGADPAC